MTNMNSNEIGTAVGNKIDSVNKTIFNEPARTYSKPYYITAKEEEIVAAEKLAIGAN